MNKLEVAQAKLVKLLDLPAKLYTYKWFNGIGVGIDRLYVYVKENHNDIKYLIPKEIDKIPIEIKIIGNVSAQ